MQFHRKNPTRAGYPPQEDSQTKKALRELKGSGKFEEEFAFLFERAQGYQIFITFDGEFVTHTREVVPENLVRSMLRRDYLSSGRGLKGRVLDEIIKHLVKALVAGAKIAATDKDYISLGCVVESLLKK